MGRPGDAAGPHPCGASEGAGDEVGAATGAGYGEKNPLRLVQRNGYRNRDWETRAGTVELRIRISDVGPCTVRQPLSSLEGPLRLQSVHSAGLPTGWPRPEDWSVSAGLPSCSGTIRRAPRSYVR
jgi:hypothetical protein